MRGLRSDSNNSFSSLNSLKYIALPWTVYVLFYLGRMNFPALIPAIIQEYGFTATQMGIATSSLFLAYTLFQTPSGFLGDRFGVRAVLTAGAFLIAAGYLVVTAWIFPAVVLGMFINGVGQSTGWGPLVKMSSKGRRKGNSPARLFSAHRHVSCIHSGKDSG